MDLLAAPSANAHFTAMPTYAYWQIITHRKNCLDTPLLYTMRIVYRWRCKVVMKLLNGDQLGSSQARDMCYQIEHSNGGRPCLQQRMHVVVVRNRKHGRACARHMV